MRDGFHALPPIPAAGESDSRFRPEFREFLKEVSWNRFRLLVWGEQIDEPDSNARRPNERCSEHYEQLLTRSRPSVMVLIARCERFTAAIPLAVTWKKRFDRPPRSGVGSPSRSNRLILIRDDILMTHNLGRRIDGFAFQRENSENTFRARDAVVHFEQDAPMLRFQARIREAPESVSQKLSSCEGARDSRSVNIRVRR